MKGMQLAIGCVAVALVAAVGAAHAATTPKLQLVDRSPLVIRGTAFGSRERVVVTFTMASTRQQRVVRATPLGTFTVRFDDASTSACAGAAVVATGGKGNVARLKISLRECPEPAIDP